MTMVKGIFRILRENAGLILCGLTSEIIWLSLFLRPQIDRFRPDMVMLNYDGIAGEGPLLVFLAAFIPYWFAYRIVRDKRRRGDLAVVGFFAALFTVTLLARVFPTGSHDAYSYAFTGRVSRWYGANPYAAAPSAYPQDAFVGLMGPFLAALKNTYGPLWTAVTSTVSALAGRGVESSVLALKLVTAGTFLAMTPLLLAVGEGIAGERKLPRTATVILYVWNPALLFEFVQNGHNDIVMLFFLMLALLFTVRKRPIAAGVGLALSVATKYVTVLALPFLCVSLFARSPERSLRGRLGRLAAFLAAFAACTVLFFLPYWQGPVTLDGLRHQVSLFAVYHLSPLPFLLAFKQAALNDVGISEFAAANVTRLSHDVLLIALGVLFLTSLPRRSKAGYPVAFALAAFATFLALGSVWTMPWHLLWLAPLLLVLGLHAELLVCSVAVFYLYGYPAGCVIMTSVVACAVIAWFRWSRAAGTLPARLAVFFD